MDAPNLKLEINKLKKEKENIIQENIQLNTSTKSIKQKKRTNTPQKEKNEQNKKNLNLNKTDLRTKKLI